MLLTRISIVLPVVLSACVIASASVTSKHKVSTVMPDALNDSAALASLSGLRPFKITLAPASASP